MLLIGWVLGQVLAAAEREYYDPAAIQRELMALEQRLEDGEIDEAEFERQEDVLLDRMEEAQQWANGTL
ncbi:gas vesicle protein GvpG [Streptomyces sp. NBRC 110028]|uniref:gas vesicle protein GvpG n=1 Tax=Streptomyces sp. NBRC 110028 TaxID=1621260 RepID=UPI0006E36684|nr:gas vesicle protein GvpG [Streptomyces sp. NBRC 110028]